MCRSRWAPILGRPARRQASRTTERTALADMGQYVAHRQVLQIAPAQVAARNNLALLLAQRGCATEARATLEPARAAAAGGPLAAEIDDSLRTIESHPENSPACRRR